MGLLDQLSERSERLSDDMTSAAEGAINPAELALRTAGETAGGLGDLISVPLGAAHDTAMKYNPVYGAVVDAATPFFKEAVGAVLEGAVNSPMYKIGEKYMKDHPEQARNLAMGANVASLIPGVALGKAGRAMTTYGKEATKGGNLATISNYIKNHYAPERSLNRGEELLAKPIEGLLGNSAAQKAVAKVVPGGVDPNNLKEAARGATLKLTSAAAHGMNAVDGALGHALSPKSQANWGENAVTSRSQRIVRNELGKMDTPTTDFAGNPGKYTRSGEKGVAQVIYGDHIGKQSGRKGNTHPVIQEITDRSFIKDAQPVSQQSLKETFMSMPYKTDTARQAKAKGMEASKVAWRDIDDDFVDEKTADFAAKYIMQKQQVNPEDGAKFVVKSPASRWSGGHYNDVVAKNPANKTLQQIWGKHADKDGNVDLGTLFTELESKREAANAALIKSGRKRDGWRVINKDMDHVNENGLWLVGGKGGSAVTEGGVMWISKLEPNGNMTSWMIDKHDFLENIPGMKTLLPEDMLAVTPALKSNIKDVVSIKKDGKRLVPKEHFRQTQPRKDWKGELPTKKGGLLEQYTEIMPSAKNVRGERVRMAGKAATAGGLLYAGDN